MTVVHARVENGKLIVDQRTDLPEGAKVDLLVLDAQDGEMSAEEAAAFEASLERGLGQAERGETIPAEVVLDRLRRS